MCNDLSIDLSVRVVVPLNETTQIYRVNAERKEGGRERRVG